MSVVTEILDRLSGIAAQQSLLDKHDEWLFDHEKRLLQLETERPVPPPAARRLPRRRP